MKKGNQKQFYFAVSFLVAFVLWTAAIRIVDVKAIGPQNTTVGFATVNGFFHQLTGVHMSLYTITDWFGLVPLGFVAGFGVLGLVQWVKRKHFWKVDHSILTLGGLYIAVMAVYLLFERFVVNYRPVLIGGVLEASHPSSTTVLVMCVMPTAIMQLNTRIQSSLLKGWVISAITVFTVFTVAGRLLSGVHWLTDIIGGILLSAGLVMLYQFIRCLPLSR